MYIIIKHALNRDWPGGYPGCPGAIFLEGDIVRYAEDREGLLKIEHIAKSVLTGEEFCIGRCYSGDYEEAYIKQLMPALTGDLELWRESECLRTGTGAITNGIMAAVAGIIVVLAVSYFCVEVIPL